MKMIKKTLPLLLLSMMLVGCGGETTPENTEPGKTEPVETEPVETGDNLPTVTLRIRLAKSEVEVGSTISLGCTVTSSDLNLKCTFTTENPDLIQINPNDNGVRAEIVGLNVGTAKVTVTSIANPNVSATCNIKVIPTKPTLANALRNITAHPYSILIGEYYNDNDMLVPTTVTQVADDMIVTVNADDLEPVIDVDNTPCYGEAIVDNKAVYLKKSGTGLTSSLDVVRSDIGLLDASNFKGRGEDTTFINEVGPFFGLETLNPTWFDAIEKNEENTYVIEGDRDLETLLSKDLNLAFAETTLLRMIDKNSYDALVTSSSGTAFATTIASSVETTIVVLDEDVLLIHCTIGDESFGAFVQPVDYVNEFDIDADVISQLSNVTDALEGIVVKDFEPSLDLADAVTAIKTNNYIQSNSIYPDHKTEYNYDVFYTPNYVFYNCNKEFRDGYNTKVDDPDKWDQIPYGFMKKNDGIYRFEYNEPLNGEAASIVWGEKEENTDANTDLYQYANYFSSASFLSNGLLASFSDTTEKLWDGESTKFHKSTSEEVMLDILKYYAPDDFPDYYEACISGIAATYTDNKVSQINVTTGFCPFVYEGSSEPKDGSYGVDRFVLKSFGAATTNPVDALLNA